MFESSVGSSLLPTDWKPYRRRAAQHRNLLDEARAFIEQYRSLAMPAYRPAENINEAPLDDFRKPLPERIVSFIHRSMTRPDLFEFDTLRAGFLNNLPWLRDTWWRMRVLVSAREYDVDRLEDLPPRFIYYPLQTTPEVLDQYAVALFRRSAAGDRRHPLCHAQRLHAGRQGTPCGRHSYSPIRRLYEPYDDAPASWWPIISPTAVP